MSVCVVGFEGRPGTKTTWVECRTKRTPEVGGAVPLACISCGNIRIQWLWWSRSSGSRVYHYRRITLVITHFSASALPYVHHPARLLPSRFDPSLSLFCTAGAYRLLVRLVLPKPPTSRGIVLPHRSSSVTSSRAHLTAHARSSPSRSRHPLFLAIQSPHPCRPFPSTL